MKFMLLTYLDEKAWLGLRADEQRRMMDECAPHVQKLVASGKLVGGAPLHPTATARTVRNVAREQLVTDGPFAETREQLGGYTILEAESMEEAVEIARGFLGTSTVTIEVRRIVSPEEMPNA